MKRLALLAVSAFMALLLSACGDNAEKKAEDNAATAVEQPQVNTEDTKKNDEVKNDEVKTDANDTVKETPAADENQQTNQ
ncbi:MAG: hypothetical protein Q8M03_01800 [Legionella sp.]|nr:hypothetical protein [Legionella sp.]